MGIGQLYCYLSPPMSPLSVCLISLSHTWPNVFNIQICTESLEQTELIPECEDLQFLGIT